MAEIKVAAEEQMNRDIQNLTINISVGDLEISVYVFSNDVALNVERNGVWLGEGFAEITRSGKRLQPSLMGQKGGIVGAKIAQGNFRRKEGRKLQGRARLQDGVKTETQIRSRKV